ncbi:MAG: hypothetical protein IJT44_08730 [Clostridia bacterium]|nr:hypothetical protein [Clostridia bacterium]
MQKDNKIIVIITSTIATVAVIVLLFLGIHYLFGNPAGWIFKADMKTFTIVTGGDYTAQQIADYMRGMRDNDLAYMRISNRVYCAVGGEETYDNLDKMMEERGYKYIGCDGNLQNMRCYYKDGKACWIRVEFDINCVWSLWNIGNFFDYDLAKDGYKNMQ